MKRKNTIWFIILLLVIDQVVKIIVKTNMTINESIPVFGEWFNIRFIENKGAAFGFQLGGDAGKLILSLFRIFAIGGIIWVIGYFRRHNAPKGVVVGFAMILAGAIGNMIDSAFYGLIFSPSTYTEVATLVPFGEGYAGFLHGMVVDMLYFPLFSGVYPDWFPFVGGESFTFFSPIFNIADSYITCAVFYLLIFKYKYFN
ncbi:MAG: lipoprotein signal peptidase [Tidjanibacter sp.]|nr:lipoprotein signal peptidase [Tidjanibacter sp.]MBR6831570.1 lipoprotein signal peptidase [Tidjanibacter sp.]